MAHAGFMLLVRDIIARPLAEAEAERLNEALADLIDIVRVRRPQAAENSRSSAHTGKPRGRPRKEAAQ